MNILFWSELYRPNIGGIEVMCSQLIEMLRSKGHTFAVVTSKSRADLPTHDRIEGIPVYRFSFHEAIIRRDLRSIKTIIEAVRDIKRAFRPDIIHLHTIQPSVFFHLHTLNSGKAPALLSVHSILPPGLALSGLLMRLFLDSRRVVAVSKAVRESIVRAAPSIGRRISVIHNGLSMSGPDAAPLPLDPPALLCLGRLIEGKGFDLALRAVAEIRALVPGITLTIAGDGPARCDLERLSVELGLAGRVTFSGWVVPENTPDLLNRAAIVLCPSREPESFGLVALEAARLGRPVVAADAAGLREVVDNGVTGLLFPVDNSGALARCLISLLENPTETRTMGEAARDHARAHFSLDRTASAYDQLYRQLRNTPGPAQGTNES